MAFSFKKFFAGIRIIPKTTSTADSQGDLDVTSAAGKLNYHNGTNASPIVTEGHTATLTGKSIDSDLNTITNIKNADIKSGAAIDRTKIASGTANHVLINDGSGILSSEATLAKSRGGSAQDNSSITFPASGVLTTNAGTQTLSNKSFSDPVTLAAVATPATPAASNGKIYFKSDGFLYQLNDSGTETKVGAGSGGINYVSNSDFESNASGYSAYADAAGSAPVDGTGGSPTVTITRSTSSPLRGTASGLITKDAANRQGQGVSYDFTISDADKAMPLAISFDYNPSSGFVAGDSSDLRVYLYDVTNAQVIQPAPYTIQGGSVSNQRFLATFQTNSNSNSYRLIFHVATTSATAWTFKFDNVQVGPQSINYGSPATDWTAYTPTIANVTTSDKTFYWRRVGDSLQIKGSATYSAAPTGEVTVTYPNGYTLDSAKWPTNASAGTVDYYDASADTHYVGFVYPASTLLHFIGQNQTNTGSPTSGTIFNATHPVSAPANGDFIDLLVTFPIAGWSSVVQMSNDTDTRVVAMSAGGSTTSLTNGADTTIINPTTSFDTHGAYNNSTGTYTIPVSGKYRATGFYHSGTSIATPSQGRQWSAGIKKNGTSVALNGNLVQVTSTLSDQFYASVSTIFSAVAGDAITFYGFQNVNNATAMVLDGNTTQNYFTVERLTGPSAIAASESVSARYNTAAGQSIPNATNTVINFGTKDFDTHGAVTNPTTAWRFTAPSSGKYLVNSMFMLANTGGWSAGETVDFYVQKNGSVFSNIGQYAAQATHSTFVSINGSTLVPLLAGDYVDIAINQGSGGAISLTASSSFNHVSITRVGN